MGFEGWSGGIAPVQQGATKAGLNVYDYRNPGNQTFAPQFSSTAGSLTVNPWTVTGMPIQPAKSLAFRTPTSSTNTLPDLSAIMPKDIKPTGRDPRKGPSGKELAFLLVLVLLLPGLFGTK